MKKEIKTRRSRYNTYSKTVVAVLQKTVTFI